MALGEIAIPAAVLNADRYPVAANSVVASLGEWSLDEFVRKHGPLVLSAAKALSGK